MKLAEFTGYHAPALEADEARHNLILGIFARARMKPEGIRYWNLGAPELVRSRRQVILSS